MLRARKNMKKTKKRPKKKRRKANGLVFPKIAKRTLGRIKEKGHLLHSTTNTTVKPVYNGHPWEMAR